MHFFQNQNLMVTPAILLVIFTLFSSSILAQEYRYLGTEPNITHEELLQKANLLDYSTESFQELYKDSKNTYFVFSTRSLENRVVKIMILELISKDNTLVNIGASPDTDLNLFLINNSLGKTTDQIREIVHGYVIQSQNEVSQLTDEQQQQWLNENDKYTKKNSTSE